MVEALENIRVKYQPTTWCKDNLVVYNEGHAWTSVIIDGQPEHCHLGKETDVKAFLSGAMPISETCSYKRQLALARILELKEVISGRETGGAGMERNGSNGISRGKQKDLRLSTARKRTTRRNANNARARVFRR